jgi:hypothetical protein
MLADASKVPINKNCFFMRKVMRRKKRRNVRTENGHGATLIM